MRDTDVLPASRRGPPPGSSADAPPPGSAGAMRERILGAAFDAFMAQGYAGTSTLDIASDRKRPDRPRHPQCHAT